MIRRNKFLLGCLVALVIGFGTTVLLAATVSGKVKSSSVKAVTVTVTDKDKDGKEIEKDMQFGLDKKGTVTRDGKKVGLQDLKAGDKATVTYEEKSSKKGKKANRASKIEATSK